MQPRDHFRILSPVHVAPVLSPDVFALLRPAHRSTIYFLRTFTPQKNDTVIARAEIGRPATDTPCAPAAGVNEFMDFNLADWVTQQECTHFLNGLNNVDAQCSTLFSKSLLESTFLQQTTPLSFLDNAVDWLHGSDLIHDDASPGSRDTQLGGESPSSREEGFDPAQYAD
jgi:hypothetical protein